MQISLTFLVCLVVIRSVYCHDDKNRSPIRAKVTRVTIGSGGMATASDAQANDKDPYLTFPKGFTIGAGGSSYQIEGGWNASDKGESIWDRLTHTRPWKIEDCSDADITCDSYHKYKEDVQWVKKMGLDHYRLSISWPRVLPNGLPESLSQDGLRYYHNLIDDLLANEIAPIVSLYHWDHPQVLEDMGGWQNESMVAWFTDYADVIFRELGPQVKVFTSINEPEVFCSLFMNAYFYDKNPDESGAYLCGMNALKAHARVYHLYDKEYRPTQQGKIGIITSCPAYFPKTPNETLAAEISFQFSCGWMSHPIFVGDHHEIFKAKIAKINRDVASPELQVPALSPKWIQYINGTADYFGLNHYTSYLVVLGSSKKTDTQKYNFWNLPVTGSTDPSWEAGTSWRMKSVPEGFGTILRKIKEAYNNPPVYVMENGFPDHASFNDYQRIKYIHSYLKELLLAVHRDGCNIQMYTAWSLLDNFEWWDGYNKLQDQQKLRRTFFSKMGLINVKFSSPDRDRSPKLSAFWLKNVTRTRLLQPPILPPASITGQGDL